MGVWRRSSRCRAQSWGWSFLIPAEISPGSCSIPGCKSFLPPAPSHLLDEVEAPVHRGVHLPASGQPCGDRPQAGSPSLSPLRCHSGAPLPREHPLEKGRMVRAGIERVMVTLCPAVVDSQKAQIVFLEKFEASPCQPQVAETSGGKGKSPRNLSPAGKATLGRGSITSHQPPNPPQLLLAQLWGVCFAFPEDFTPHFPTVVPPGAGAEPHLRRRSARSGWSSPCPGAPSSWIWCRRCEGQGQRGCQHPRGAQEPPPHRWGDFSSQRSGF